MSRHEGVSCDSCLKGNFRGRRYKCLVCYDYDLCATCYESGATNTRHTVDHPMQCILTRAYFELYYGGEALTNVEQPQSYVCPYCGRMGFTEATLLEHVTAEHFEPSFEVVCPICASIPGGDPNLMTDDFARHLSLEHRGGTHDLISFLDDPVATRVHHVRRIPHSGHLTAGSRNAQAGRPRRSNMHFSVFSSGALSSMSPSSRDTVDPIAELLSQLSGVRRPAGSTSSSTPTQLQQLQMQLQLERQQVNTTRQQLERLPRRQTQSQTVRESTVNTGSNASQSTLILNPSPAVTQVASNSIVPVPPPTHSFLLASLLDEAQSSDAGEDRVEFLRQLLLSTLILDEETDMLKQATIPELPLSLKESENMLDTFLPSTMLRAPAIEEILVKQGPATDIELPAKIPTAICCYPRGSDGRF